MGLGLQADIRGDNGQDMVAGEEDFMGLLIQAYVPRRVTRSPYYLQPERIYRDYFPVAERNIGRGYATEPSHRSKCKLGCR